MPANEQNHDGLKAVATAVMSVVSVILAITVLVCVLISGNRVDSPAANSGSYRIMDQFDGFVAQVVTSAKDAAYAVPKTFQIDDGAEVPQPHPTGYGTATDPAELQSLLDAAADLLDGQDTLFTTETEIKENSTITYYYDETILAITWLEVRNNMIYTIAEVKIAHPSQFIRYMADGDFKSKNLYTTTEMSAQAGAVIAGSGDYFKSRDAGIVVYDGKVERCYGAKQMDTCLVDRSGNLILMPRGSFKGAASVQEFVDANDISFSFAFGPILINDGVRCEPKNYGLGEPEGHYCRAAIGQRDELHYLMVVANGSSYYCNYPDIHMFADEIEKMGCQKAYAMDGGQTGAIVMQHQLMNPTEYKNGQRHISDMYFFATALPQN